MKNDIFSLERPNTTGVIKKEKVSDILVNKNLIIESEGGDIARTVSNKTSKKSQQKHL